jgi:hypothetical protein
MARYPGAEWHPLGKTTSTLTTPDLLCLHTMVGYLHSTDAYFRTVSVFSHFGIGGKWGSDPARGLDGKVWQWGDTAYRAAANLSGNYRVISVETADNAARPIQPWTPAQETAIVGLMVWAHRAHGIPLALVPDSKPGRRGICYHRQGCDPYRVAGGELWSSSYGKDCPTQVRIDRIPALISRARAIVAGIPIEEVDVPLTAADGQTVWNTKVEIPVPLRPEYGMDAYPAEAMLVNASYHAMEGHQLLVQVAARLNVLAATQLAATTSARDVILAGLKLIDTSGWTDAERHAQAEAIAALVSGATASAIIDELASRPLSIGPTPPTA